MADLSKCIRFYNGSISLADCNGGGRNTWEYFANGFIGLSRTRKCLGIVADGSAKLLKRDKLKYQRKKPASFRTFMINENHNTIAAVFRKPGYALTRKAGNTLCFEEYLSSNLIQDNMNHMWKFE